MRDFFVAWCRDAGTKVSVDRMGNIFARRAGSENDAAPVLVGSHLDTQYTGGKFDGILGVLAGLEILRTLDDHGIETRRPIEVVNWSNEEGARFNLLAASPCDLPSGSDGVAMAQPLGAGLEAVVDAPSPHELAAVARRGATADGSRCELHSVEEQEPPGGKHRPAPDFGSSGRIHGPEQAPNLRISEQEPDERLRRLQGVVEIQNSLRTASFEVPDEVRQRGFAARVGQDACENRCCPTPEPLRC